MTGLLRDALHSNYIGRVHCIPGHVPRTRSCCYTAADYIRHECRRLDCSAVVIELHLHCISDQACGTIVVVQKLPPQSFQLLIQKKIKKTIDL